MRALYRFASALVGIALTSASIVPASGAETGPARSAVIVVKIRAVDLDKSIAFYEKVLGMKETTRIDAPWPTSRIAKGDMNGGKRLTEVGLKFGATVEEAKADKGNMIMLLHIAGEAPPYKAPDQEADVVISVPDVQAVAKNAVAAGGTIYAGPMDIGGGTKAVMVIDPAGNVVEAIQPPAR